MILKVIITKKTVTLYFELKFFLCLFIKLDLKLVYFSFNCWVFRLIFTEIREFVTYLFKITKHFRNMTQKRHKNQKNSTL